MVKLEELSYNGKIVLTIKLDEENNSLVFADVNNNVIRFGENGISLESSNITVQATQNLTLKGNAKVTIESTEGDVVIKGLNIKNDAEMIFSADGRASAELKGGVQTTIKGGIVLIN